MKRSFFSLFLFLVGVAVLAISIWRARPPLISPVLADLPQEENVVTEEASPSVSIEEEDYSLPYPGILPDSPFYVLKMMRDQILLVLTRDPVARAELLIHYADKRIAASLALAERGKVGLAVSTAIKAEGYLEQALSVAEEATEKGKDMSGFYKQAVRSTVKHMDVLMGVQSRTPSEARGSLEDALEMNALASKHASDLANR